MSPRSGPRSPAPVPGRRPRAWMAWTGAALLLALSAAVLGVLLTRPRIAEINPAFAEPGAVVSISGSNFGSVRGDSRVEVDGVAPTTSSYLEWRQDRISVRFPGTVDSGLVYVVTARGRSNPKLFMNKARLPAAPESLAASVTGPWVGSLSVAAGSIGSPLVISGSGFGAADPSRSVRFAWSPEDPPGGAGERGSVRTVAPFDTRLAYELWSDREIRLRVPDGAVSGAVFVHSPQGDSNGLFFDVSDAPGSKRYYDRRSYSVSYSVSISKVQASGANELWLHVPLPVDSAFQLVVRSLAQDPAPEVANDRGFALYRFRDLAQGQDADLKLSWLVQSYAIETRIEPERIKAYDSQDGALIANLVEDALVPANAPEIQGLARKIAGQERNPYRIARAVQDWLVKNLRWTEGRDQKGPVPALVSRRADSWDYGLVAAALLRAAGVPARPLAGLLIDPSLASVRHSWVEFWIQGLGWVPMDPILASGARPGGFVPAFQDLSRYFCNVDDRRIAFSRGYAELEPRAAAGRRSLPALPVAYQTYYEESAGALEAYSSFWSDIQVTGLY